MGWAVPEFAHVPLIHGADGAKLSKRHGAQGVEEFRAMGYLPEALRNYLVRLGWSHGDDEIISAENLLRWFDIDGINKAPARLDFKKLDDLNGHYIRAASDEELARQVREMLPHLDFKALSEIAIDPKAPARSDIALAREVLRQLPHVATGAELANLFATKGWDVFLRAIPALKERSKTLTELIAGALFIVAERPIRFEDKAAKLLNGEGRASNAAALKILSAIPENDWKAPTLEAAVKAHAEATGAKLGSIAQPLRAALTGRAVSPPVFDVLELLGRDEVLARISDASVV
jgi:glutamyl-tRNA synthetase